MNKIQLFISMIVSMVKVTGVVSHFNQHDATMVAYAVIYGYHGLNYTKTEVVTRLYHEDLHDRAFLPSEVEKIFKLSLTLWSIVDNMEEYNA